MTTAWVFPGNGALGAFACGSASVLAARFGYPDHLYGISSGSINAFGFAYMGALHTTEFWHSIRSFSDAFKPNYFRLLSADGVFRPAPKLVKGFKEAIDRRKYPSTNMTVWTIKNETGEAIRHDILKGQVEASASDIALASCSIPGVVQSHSIKGEGHSDAGFRLLAPFSAAIKDGHDEIIVISGRPLDEPVLRPKLHFPVAESAYQAVDVALSEILRRDLAEMTYKNSILGFKQIRVKVIAPDRGLGGPLDFANCRSFLREGRNKVSKMITEGQLT